MTGQAHTVAARAVKFSRLPRRGMLLGLGGAQLAVLGCGAAVLVIALYVGGGTAVTSLPVVGCCAALALVPAGGRPVVEWLPVVASWGWRTVTRQREFRARITRPRPSGSLALPGDAAALRQYTDPVTGAVLVHDPHAATLTVTLTVTHPAFVLLDSAEQQRHVDAWGRVLATVCRSGRVASLQVAERVLPESGRSLADWWDKHGVDDGTWPARVYRQLIERAGPTAERHASMVSLSLDTHAASRAIRAAGGGLAGAATILRQETETLTTALRAAELSPTGPLEAADLATVLRSAYDPGAAAGLDRQPVADRDLTTAGPVAVTEHWGMLRSDSCWHAVLWISQWPQSRTYPGFLGPLLLTAGIRRCLAIRYEPVRPDIAARDLRRKKTGYTSDAAQRARLGQTEDATQTSEHADVLAQEAELTAGHGMLRATGLIAVSARDPDGLESVIASVEQAAVQAGCETRRLWGQQAQALAATLPLGRPI